MIEDTVRLKKIRFSDKVVSVTSCEGSLDMNHLSFHLPSFVSQSILEKDGMFVLSLTLRDGVYELSFENADDMVNFASNFHYLRGWINSLYRVREEILRA